MSPRAAQVRIYLEADLPGLGKIPASLRNDATYPGDPAATCGIQSVSTTSGLAIGHGARCR